MRHDNELMIEAYRLAEQERRNDERIRRWRIRYQRTTGYYPMGDIRNHKIITRTLPCAKN